MSETKRYPASYYPMTAIDGTPLAHAENATMVLAADYDRDLADMRRQRDEATAREHLLRAAAQELLDDMAEDIAQRHHADKYRVFQISPEAVEKVRAALAAKEPSDE